MTSTLRTLLDRVEQGEGADWLRHEGGDCPVAHDALVEVLYEDGNYSIGLAGKFARALWRHEWETEGDIIAYRIVGGWRLSSPGDLALLRAKIAQEREQ